MLEPVLDPFHRPARDARRDPHQRDVGEDALLHAEAAAGIRRHAQAQPVARHFQRARQHRMDAERPLEGGEHVVGVLARIVVGDQPVGFDRRAGVARIVDRDRHAMRGGRECGFRIAVAERAVARDVRAEPVMQHGAVGFERIGRPQGDRQRLVIDLDQLQRVLGEVTVRRHHHGDRLADIAHALDRDRPALDVRLHAGEQRRPERGHLGRGDHRRDALRGARRAHVDRADDRMRMRRAQHGGVQRARRHAEIVDVAPAPGEQGRVLHPLDRLPDPAHSKAVMRFLHAALSRKRSRRAKRRSGNRTSIDLGRRTLQDRRDNGKLCR